MTPPLSEREDAPCNGCYKNTYCGVVFPQLCKEMRQYILSIKPTWADDSFFNAIPTTLKPTT